VDDEGQRVQIRPERGADGVAAERLDGCDVLQGKVCIVNPQLGSVDLDVDPDADPADPPEERGHDRQHHEVRHPGAQAGIAKMDLGGEERSRGQADRPPPQREAQPFVMATHGCEAIPTGPGETDSLFPMASPEDDHGMALPVLVQRLDEELPLPAYAHPGDAGADLVTAVDAELGPGERAVLPTGIAIALPEGYAAFVHPRSGLAARFGVTLVNSPGTIDTGYRGEIKVIVINHDSTRPVSFRRGDRIAQLVVQRVERVHWIESGDLPDSARAAGRHGSTGGHAGLESEPDRQPNTAILERRSDGVPPSR